MKFFTFCGLVLFSLARYVFVGVAYAGERAMTLMFGGGGQVGSKGYNGAAPSTVKTQPSAAKAAGDFKETVQLEAIPKVEVKPVEAPKLQPYVLRAAQAQAAPAVPAVSERVHLVGVYGPKDHQFGVIWFYLYPREGKAKRLFKVQDRDLARSMKNLKNERYFMSDMNYDPREGLEPLKRKTLDEVRKLLGQREATGRDQRRDEAVVTKPAAPAKAAAAPASAPTPAKSVEPAVKADAPSHVRQVKGDAICGVVTVARRMPRQGRNGEYQSFCLTVFDGQKEVPQYGAELERAVADQRITVGEKVKVVYMGKQPIDVPGSEERTYKNLYQVTRLPA